MKLAPYAVIVLLLAFWLAATSFAWVSPLFAPSPQEVAQTAFGQLFVTGELWGDAAATFGRMIAGFVIAIIVGVSLGLAMGYFASVHHALEFAVDFFRSIPATALFPLFLLFFGIGDEAKIAVAVWACSFVVIVNTAHGVRHASKLRITAAKTMGGRGFFLFRNVLLPEALPHIMAGLKIALSYSLVVVIVTEMFIGTNLGLGRRIIDAQMVYRVPEMYVAIIAAGVLGFALNKLFVAIERRLVHWSGR